MAPQPRVDSHHERRVLRSKIHQAAVEAASSPFTVEQMGNLPHSRPSLPIRVSGCRVLAMQVTPSRSLRSIACLLIGAALIAGFAQGSVPQSKPAATAPTVPPATALPRLLVFSKTASFRHDSIPTGIACIRELLSARYEIDATEDASVFTAENLARYKAIVFLSTTGNILDPAQEAALEKFVHAGGGFAGIHAAADTEHEWPWYGKLVGAYFLTHPKPQESTVIVEKKDHPSTAMLPDRWTRFDEWYVYKDNPRARVHVLASLDDSTVEGDDMNGDHPIAWFQEFEGGRSWYTGGGHTKESYAEPLFRAHIEAGIRWAAGESMPSATAPTTPLTPLK